MCPQSHVNGSFLPESAQAGAKPVNASIIPLKPNLLNNVISRCCSIYVGKHKHRELSGKSGSKMARDPLLWPLKKEISMFLWSGNCDT